MPYTEQKLEDAVRRARYGHRSWLFWRDRQGMPHAERKSRESIKRCLLDVGTKGNWVLVQANTGHLLKGFWWLGINLINQYKYNCASE